MKPGQGKLFRIAPATELTLGRMSTNLYNNARHITPIEDSTGVKKYFATYARDGKIVVSYPTEVSEGAVHRKAAIPVDSVIDGTGDRINPAIGYNPNTGKIGLIYASVSSGATVDTNFIWYRHSSIGTPYLFSPATILDTVLVLRAADPTFLTTPAITPCFESGYDFWLSWRAELNKGGVLGLVNSSDVLQANKAFFATGNKQPKFISVTSHKSLAGVRLAWEEYGTSQIQIYYTTGTVSSNVITVAGITDISSLLGVCEAHHPQIATDENGEDQVVWEAFSAISQKVKNTFSTKFSNATYHRTRNHNTGKWSDCDQFFPVSNSLSTSSTAPTNYTFYPNIAYTNAVLLSSVGGGWLDFERITWNNKDSAHSEIVHLGLGTWKGAIMQDGSLEPAMAQCVQTYQIPDAMLFRDPVHQIDSNYDAKMTRSVFPLTPVREVTSTNLVWKQIQINPRSQCAIIKTGDGGGIIAPPGGGKRVINLQPRLEIASDTSQMPPSSASTWGDLSARTKGFVIHAYDTLKYWRYFQLGDDYQPSDTTAYKNAFSDTNDYIKSRVNLRKISDSSLVRVLDTVMMKRNSIVTSGMITTTGGSYVAPYGFTGDSLFMSVEVTRGNANDSWDISYTDVFADTTSTGSMQAFKVAREWNPTPSNTQVSPIVSVVPNPFRQTAMVNIITTTGFPLNVALFDELGRKVTELTNVVADHSEYQFILGTEPLATGMYYLRVQSGSAVVTQQVELLK